METMGVFLMERSDVGCIRQRKILEKRYNFPNQGKQDGKW